MYLGEIIIFLVMMLFHNLTIIERLKNEAERVKARVLQHVETLKDNKARLKERVDGCETRTKKKAMCSKVLQRRCRDACSFL